MHVLTIVVSEELGQNLREGKIERGGRNREIERENRGRIREKARKRSRGREMDRSEREREFGERKQMFN